MADIQEMHQKLLSSINEIDEQLDSLDDSSGATKRKIMNELVRENEEVSDKVAANIISQITTLQESDPDALVGVLKGFIDKVNAHFKEFVDTYVNAKVEASPKQEPLVTAEEAEVLSKERSQLYQSIKMVVELASTIEGIQLEMPKTRRGSRGKRGARAMSLMIWAIDGVELDPQPKYKDLAISVGFEGSKELTAFLKSKEIDTRNPKDGKLSVDLPDGRILSGELPTEDDEEEDEDEDEDETEES
jgi:hypothetical protein